MQSNVKRRAVSVADARRTLLGLAEKVPTVQAAADTGIHQSQVSRLFRGQFTRISPNVRTLLDYAPGGARPRPAPAPGKDAVIREALKTWDSTAEGARALVKLLKSVREMRAGRAGGRRAR
jgi:hypothetical protein